MQLLASFENYTLYRLSKNGDIVLRVVSISSSKSADHNKIEIRLDGHISSRLIIENDIISISERFAKYGPSQAFSLTNGSSTSYRPDEVLHRTTTKEKSYTSTGDKLDFHWPIFKKLRETKYGSIIRATMTMHQVCSSRCSFCSTINRKSDDSISLDEAKRFIDSLSDEQASYNKLHFKEYNDLYKNLTGNDIALQGLILSGGGQPNLWHGFEELVEYVNSKGIELGLITNGFPKNINDAIYDKFKWIRLSITPPEASPHYSNGKFEDQYIPPNILSLNRVPTLGLSYVYGPWSSIGDLKRLNSFAEAYSIDYVRSLVDCNLARKEQLSSHNILSEKLLNEGLIDAKGNPTGRIFHQLKYHMEPSDRFEIWDSGQCWLQSYNVFWDTTGHDENGKSFCFPCDSVTVLTEENASYAARGFDGSKWGTVTNDHVEDLYKNPITSYFDPRENCGACLFHKNNIRVKQIMSDDSKSQLRATSPQAPKHLSFP